MRPPRACRASDCQRAEATNFTTAACLCDDTQPYLSCMAKAVFEANTTIQALLANTFITVDPGLCRIKAAPAVGLPRGL